MDRRFAERRREVGETKARSGLARSLALLLALAVLAGVVWLFQSPHLSVRDVRIEGAGRSDAAALANSAGAVEGRPMILVDAGGVTEAIEADPWVAEVEVERRWPDIIVVRVTERIPVAWVLAEGSWNLVDASGVVLGSDSLPDDDGRPLINGGAGLADAVVLAAVRFADSLRADLAVGAVIAVADGQINALVGDYEVRVGGPEDVDLKAKALAAVLDTDPEPGSIVTVIAPTRPAVAPPISQP